MVSEYCVPEFFKFMNPKTYIMENASEIAWLEIDYWKF